MKQTNNNYNNNNNKNTILYDKILTDDGSIVYRAKEFKNEQVVPYNYANTGNYDNNNKFSNIDNNVYLNDKILEDCNIITGINGKNINDCYGFDQISNLIHSNPYYTNPLKSDYNKSLVVSKRIKYNQEMVVSSGGTGVYLEINPSQPSNIISMYSLTAPNTLVGGSSRSIMSKLNDYYTSYYFRSCCFQIKNISKELSTVDNQLIADAILVDQDASFFDIDTKFEECPYSDPSLININLFEPIEGCILNGGRPVYTNFIGTGVMKHATINKLLFPTNTYTNTPVRNGDLIGFGSLAVTIYSTTAVTITLSAINNDGSFTTVASVSTIAVATNILAITRPFSHVSTSASASLIIDYFDTDDINCKKLILRIPPPASNATLSIIMDITYDCIANNNIVSELQGEYRRTHDYDPIHQEFKGVIKSGLRQAHAGTFSNIAKWLLNKIPYVGKYLYKGVEYIDKMDAFKDKADSKPNAMMSTNVNLYITEVNQGGIPSTLTPGKNMIITDQYIKGSNLYMRNGKQVLFHTYDGDDSLYISSVYQPRFEHKELSGKQVWVKRVISLIDKGTPNAMMSNKDVVVKVQDQNKVYVRLQEEGEIENPYKFADKRRLSIVIDPKEGDILWFVDDAPVIQLQVVDGYYYCSSVPQPYLKTTNMITKMPTSIRNSYYCAIKIEEQPIISNAMMSSGKYSAIDYRKNASGVLIKKEPIVKPLDTIKVLAASGIIFTPDTSSEKIQQNSSRGILGYGEEMGAQFFPIVFTQKSEKEIIITGSAIYTLVRTKNAIRQPTEYAISKVGNYHIHVDKKLVEGLVTITMFAAFWETMLSWKSDVYLTVFADVEEFKPILGESWVAAAVALIVNAPNWQYLTGTFDVETNLAGNISSAIVQEKQLAIPNLPLIVMGTLTDSNISITTEWDFFFTGSILSPTIVGSLLIFIQMARYPLASKGYTLQNYSKAGVISITSGASDMVKYVNAANYVLNNLIVSGKQINNEKLYEILTGKDPLEAGIGDKEVIITPQDGESYTIKMNLAGKLARDSTPGTFLYTYKGMLGNPKSPLYKADDIAIQCKSYDMPTAEFVILIGTKYYFTSKSYLACVNKGFSEYRPVKDSKEPTYTKFISDLELLEAFKVALTSKGYITDSSGEVNVQSITDFATNFDLNVRQENLKGKAETAKQRLYQQLVRVDPTVTNNMVSRLKAHIIKVSGGMLNEETLRSAMQYVKGSENNTKALGVMLNGMFPGVVDEVYKTIKNSMSNITVKTGTSILVDSKVQQVQPIIQNKIVNISNSQPIINNNYKSEIVSDILYNPLPKIMYYHVDPALVYELVGDKITVKDANLIGSWDNEIREIKGVSEEIRKKCVKA